MSEGQHTVDDASGIKHVDKVRVSNGTDCGKCGESIGESAFGYTGTIEVTYADLPTEWGAAETDRFGKATLCQDCADNLRTRVDHRIRGTFAAHLHSDPHS